VLRSALERFQHRAAERRVPGQEARARPISANLS